MIRGGARPAVVGGELVWSGGRGGRGGLMDWGRGGVAGLVGIAAVVAGGRAAVIGGWRIAGVAAIVSVVEVRRRGVVVAVVIVAVVVVPLDVVAPVAMMVVFPLPAVVIPVAARGGEPAVEGVIVVGVVWEDVDGLGVLGVVLFGGVLAVVGSGSRVVLGIAVGGLRVVRFGDGIGWRGVGVGGLAGGVGGGGRGLAAGVEGLGIVGLRRGGGVGVAGGRRRRVGEGGAGGVCGGGVRLGDVGLFGGATGGGKSGSECEELDVAFNRSPPVVGVRFRSGGTGEDRVALCICREIRHAGVQRVNRCRQTVGDVGVNDANAALRR